jgi:methylmalonyl-CoA/ethylmalonyl-CoA epimerase
MFNKVRVIHMAVNSIAEATKDYQERFGLKVARTGELAREGIRTAIVPISADVVIEFIEPINKEQGAVAKFLQTRGEGVYMMGWEVDNIDAAVKGLQAKGVRLINAEPEARAKGANVFIHPKFAHGLMIELLEKPKENR